MTPGTHRRQTWFLGELLGRFRALVLRVCLAAALAGASSGGPLASSLLWANEGFTLAGPAMGSTYRIQVAQPPSGFEQAALHAAVERYLADFDLVFSTYRSDSELAKLNAASAGPWHAVSPRLYELLALARRLSETSGGRFDITAAPLIKLWKIAAADGPAAPPSEAQIAAAREKTGNKAWELRPEQPAVRKRHKGVSFNVNAVAPGFAVDGIFDLLQSRGLPHFLIEVGGEVRVAGRNDRGQPWRVGLEWPAESNSPAVWRTFDLERGALATSGDYRQFRELGGQRFAHIIDLAAGRPVVYRGASVVVLAENCAAADAWATALFSCPTPAGIELANSQGLTACFLIAAPGDLEVTVHASQEFARRYPNFGVASAGRGTQPRAHWWLVGGGLVLVGALGCAASRYLRREVPRTWRAKTSEAANA